MRGETGGSGAREGNRMGDQEESTKSAVPARPHAKAWGGGSSAAVVPGFTVEAFGSRSASSGAEPEGDRCIGMHWVGRESGLGSGRGSGRGLAVELALGLAVELAREHAASDLTVIDSMTPMRIHRADRADRDDRGHVPMAAFTLRAGTEGAT